MNKYLIIAIGLILIVAVGLAMYIQKQPEISLLLNLNNQYAWLVLASGGLLIGIISLNAFSRWSRKRLLTQKQDTRNIPLTIFLIIIVVVLSVIHMPFWLHIGIILLLVLVIALIKNYLHNR